MAENNQPQSSGNRFLDWMNSSGTPPRYAVGYLQGSALGAAALVVAMAGASVLPDHGTTAHNIVFNRDNVELTSPQMVEATMGPAAQVMNQFIQDSDAYAKYVSAGQVEAFRKGPLFFHPSDPVDRDFLEVLAVQNQLTRERNLSTPDPERVSRLELEVTDAKKAFIEMHGEAALANSEDTLWRLRLMTGAENALPSLSQAIGSYVPANGEDAYDNAIQTHALLGAVAEEVKPEHRRLVEALQQHIVPEKMLLGYDVEIERDRTPGQPWAPPEEHFSLTEVQIHDPALQTPTPIKPANPSFQDRFFESAEADNFARAKAANLLFQDRFFEWKDRMVAETDRLVSFPGKLLDALQDQGDQYFRKDNPRGSSAFDQGTVASNTAAQLSRYTGADLVLHEKLAAAMDLTPEEAATSRPFFHPNVQEDRDFMAWMTAYQKAYSAEGTEADRDALKTATVAFSAQYGTTGLEKNIERYERLGDLVKDAANAEAFAARKGDNVTTISLKSDARDDLIAWSQGQRGFDLNETQDRRVLLNQQEYVARAGSDTLRQRFTAGLDQVLDTGEHVLAAARTAALGQAFSSERFREQLGLESQRAGVEVMTTPDGSATVKLPGQKPITITTKPSI